MRERRALSVENNKKVIRRLAEILNSGELDALEEVFAPGYTRHDPSPLLEDAGVVEYREAFGRLRRAFPDASWQIQELLAAEGGRVIGRWLFRGTHTGPFFNLAPTGKEVTYPIIAIYRMEGGKVAEDWHLFHALGLWQTLMPEIEAAITAAMENPE